MSSEKPASKWKPIVGSGGFKRVAPVPRSEGRSDESTSLYAANGVKSGGVQPVVSGIHAISLQSTRGDRSRPSLVPHSFIDDVQGDSPPMEGARDRQTTVARGADASTDRIVPRERPLQDTYRERSSGGYREGPSNGYRERHSDDYRERPGSGHRERHSDGHGYRDRYSDRRERHVDGPRERAQYRRDGHETRSPGYSDVPSTRRETTERLEREKAALEEAERAERLKWERAARERTEREREKAERLAREKTEREEADRLARENAERLAREESDRLAREETDRIAQERARKESERLAAEKAAEECAAREKELKEKAERDIEAHIQRITSRHKELDRREVGHESTGFYGRHDAHGRYPPAASTVRRDPIALPIGLPKRPDARPPVSSASSASPASPAFSGRKWSEPLRKTVLTPTLRQHESLPKRPEPRRPVDTRAELAAKAQELFKSAKIPGKHDFKVTYDPDLDPALSRQERKATKPVRRVDGEGLDIATPRPDPRQANPREKKPPHKYRLLTYEYNSNSYGPPPPTCVVCTGYSQFVSEDDVRRHFSKFGTVDKLIFERDPATGGSLGICWVRYPSHTLTTGQFVTSAKPTASGAVSARNAIRGTHHGKIETTHALFQTGREGTVRCGFDQDSVCLKKFVDRVLKKKYRRHQVLQEKQVQKPAVTTADAPAAPEPAAPEPAAPAEPDRKPNATQLNEYTSVLKNSLDFARRKRMRANLSAAAVLGRGDTFGTATSTPQDAQTSAALFLNGKRKRPGNASESATDAHESSGNSTPPPLIFNHSLRDDEGSPLKQALGAGGDRLLSSPTNQALSLEALTKAMSSFSSKRKKREAGVKAESKTEVEGEVEARRKDKARRRKSKYAFSSDEEGGEDSRGDKTAHKAGNETEDETEDKGEAPAEIVPDSPSEIHAEVAHTMAQAKAAARAAKAAAMRASRAAAKAAKEEAKAKAAAAREAAKTSESAEQVTPDTSVDDTMRPEKKPKLSHDVGSDAPVSVSEAASEAALKRSADAAGFGDTADAVKRQRTLRTLQSLSEEDAYLLRTYFAQRRAGRTLEEIRDFVEAHDEEKTNANENVLDEAYIEQHKNNGTHPSGCARTEGHYRLNQTQKQRSQLASSVEARLAHKLGVTSIDGNSASIKTDAKNLSRSARAATRSLVKGYKSADTDFAVVSQLGARKKKLTFEKSNIEGYGLYALENINPGEMVIEYVGELIRAAVAENREKQYERQGIGSSYLFRVDEDWVVDATKKGSIARLINHCCVPNCMAKIITINGVKKIVIYAKTPINAGDEVTYDYHFPHEEEKIPCRCGHPQCRKYLN